MKKLLHKISILLLLGVVLGWKSGHNYPSIQEIRVMTYNVHHCSPPDTPGKIDVAATAAVIKSQHADLVAIQEVDVNTGRSGHIDEAKLLAKEAGFSYYYFAKTMNFDGGEYGILILSRFALEKTKTILLPKAVGESAGEQRALALAQIKLPGRKTIQFACTHLEAYHRNSREMQAAKIVEIAKQTNLPMILCGDMNAMAGSKTISILNNSFSRTCDHCPATFWEKEETGAIDFIFYKKQGNFKVIAHQVIDNKTASDHMPVVATLQVL